jgi:hypothetical protein
LDVELEVADSGVGKTTCGAIWDGILESTFNPAECAAIQLLTATEEDPCGCKEVGTDNYCAPPSSDSGKRCDMCQGNGDITIPSKTIRTGAWANTQCATMLEMQDLFEFTEAQCTAAKNAAAFCGCGGSSGFGCFSGQTKVVVKGQGEVLMSSLRLGDEVLVADSKYERVYSFGHRHESVETEYLQLYSSSSAPLEITKEHMIIIEDGRALPASTVQIGDKLKAVNGAVVEVNAIKTVPRKGAYAPFTTSGTIVVNDVVASTFVAFQAADVLTIGGVKLPFSFQWLAHTFESPHRFYCSYASECLTEEYTEEGVSKWVSAPLVFWVWLFGQNILIMSLVLTPIFCVFLCLGCINASMGNLSAILLLGATLWSRKRVAQKM